MCLLNELCFYSRGCGLSAPALFISSLFFPPEAPVSKSGPGYSGGPRIQRQEQVIHLSPKKGSQVRCDLFLCICSHSYNSEYTFLVFFFVCVWPAVGRPLLWTLQQ